MCQPPGCSRMWAGPPVGEASPLTPAAPLHSGSQQVLQRDSSGFGASCLQMSYTDTTSSQSKAPEDEPPSYNLIAPYAPPDTSAPSAPPHCEIDSALLKGVPPGLEQLLQINQLTVKEKFSVSQGWSCSFEVLNHVGQRLFKADQSVVCCGPIYDVKIKDNSDNEVLHLLENCSCTCTREIQVLCPLGSPIGFVRLHWNNLVTHLSVMDSSREVTLLILGPSFQTSVFGSSTFEVKSRDEQHVVGMIKTESDHLLVTFPLDLEVTVKAMLLGAALYLNNLIKTKRRNLERNARHN